MRYERLMRFRWPVVLVAVMLCTVWSGSAARGGEEASFEGKVVDTKGRPVQGAMVFLYASPEVRRTANFISNRTDSEGRYRVVVPAGKYWAVARLKTIEGYGPLRQGDKHSGDPVEAEAAAGRATTLNFTVADLQEAIRTKARDRERAFKITGRIVDEGGTPVPGAYAIANRGSRIIGIPDFLSAWADDNGGYTLFLPRGQYYLGASVIFPPGKDYTVQGQISVEGDRQGVDIIVKKAAGR